jgi:hypothetical protein
MAGDGRRWPEMAGDGRRWPEMAGDGRRSQDQTSAPPASVRARRTRPSRRAARDTEPPVTRSGGPAPTRTVGSPHTNGETGNDGRGVAAYVRVSSNAQTFEMQRDALGVLSQNHPTPEGAERPAGVACAGRGRK